MDLVPPPPQAVKPESPDFAGSEEFFGPRIAACVIDFALLLGLYVALAATIGEASVGGGQFSVYPHWPTTILYLALVLLYYFALEAAIGRTVGKLLAGVRVVGRDGRRPTISAVAIRTVLRLVDWLPLLYLAGFVSMLATGARRQRLGDLAAGTRVPHATPMRHRGLAVAAVASSLVLVVAGSIVYVAVSGEGGRTYRDHGVSFAYPVEWSQGEPSSPAGEGGAELWNVTVGIGDDVDGVSISVSRLNTPVTAQNLDAVKTELTPQVEQAFERDGGTIQTGPEEITMAGKPGLQFTGTGSVNGTPVEHTLVFAFDGTTQYYVNCQYIHEKAAEIRQGCDQILRTFKVH